MTECRHVFVSGVVQGVAFRWSAQQRAVALGVTGWVRNLADRRVEVWIEGDVQAVAAMLEWLGRGPPGARVDRLDVREERPAPFDDFDVRPSAYA